MSEWGTVESITRRLRSAIKQSHELEAEASNLQSDVANPPDSQAIRSFRDQYLEWYTDCQVLLTPEDRATFVNLYISGSYPHAGIRKFFSSGDETIWIEEPSGEFQWAYPFQETFEVSIVEQRLLLLQTLKQLQDSSTLNVDQSSDRNTVGPMESSLLAEVQVELGAIYDYMIEGNFAPPAIMNIVERAYRLDVTKPLSEIVPVLNYASERLTEFYDEDLREHTEIDTFPPRNKRLAADAVDRLASRLHQLNGLEKATQGLHLEPMSVARVQDIRLPEGYGHLENDCRRFLRDHPDFDKNVFIMTRFDSDNPSKALDAQIREILVGHKLVPLRADDKTYSTDRNLWSNVCIYMLCCKFGIAVLENRNADEFNANVALEYGFMRALNRQTLLLADKGFHTIKSDVVGTLRERFDIADLDGTLAPSLRRWLRDLDILETNPGF